MNNCSFKKETHISLMQIKKKFFIVLLLVFIIAIDVCFALHNGHYADFFPINGTFQDYNPIRHFLSGHIPFRDFYDYLGLGHLYSGTVMSIFFGKTYQSSIMIFSFLTLFCVSFIFIIYGSCILNNTVLSIVSTLTFIVFVLLLTDDYGFTKHIYELFNSGNSARLVRGLCLPIISVLICFPVYYKKLFFIKNNYITYNIILPIYFGSICGITILWSNDFGFSCVFSLFIFLNIIYFFKLKTKSLKNYIIKILVFIASFLLSFAIWCYLLTFGNLKGWIDFTLGVSNYQRWYYNNDDAFYITQLELSFLTVILILITIIYLSFLLKNKLSVFTIFRYGLPAYMNISCLIAIQLYKFVSGGYSFQVALVVIIASIYFEFLNFIGNFYSIKNNVKKIFICASCVLCVYFIIYSAMDEMQFKNTSHDNIYYSDELKGYVRTYGLDIKSIKEHFSNKSFFSEYSSAQDIISHCFQPSGIDYIIHTLSDNMREKYLQAFHSNNFDYVTTINPNVTDWAFWAERANWFWFREVYKFWKPIYVNKYLIIWGKNKNENILKCNKNIDVLIEYISENCVKLSVNIPYNFDGFADIYIDYTVEKKSTLGSIFCFKTMLRTENRDNFDSKYLKYESNNLRPKGAEFIPIKIKNGSGSVYLTSLPKDATELKIHTVSCNELIPNPLKNICNFNNPTFIESIE